MSLGLPEGDSRWKPGPGEHLGGFRRGLDIPETTKWIANYVKHIARCIRCGLRAFRNPCGTRRANGIATVRNLHPNPDSLIFDDRGGVDACHIS